jgi:hypothetical protein
MNAKAHVKRPPRTRLKYLGKRAEASMPFEIAFVGMQRPNWEIINARAAKATAARAPEESFAWDCKIERSS